MSKLQSHPSGNRTVIRNLALFATYMPILLALAALLYSSPASARRLLSPPLMTTTPGLYPDFDPAISDYIVRSTPGSPLQIDINTPFNSNVPFGTQVSVDAQGYRSGIYSTSVTLNAGQSFAVAVKQNGVLTNTYYVRCVPQDFPTYTVQNTGPTQAEWYLLAPNSFSFPRTNYLIVVDKNGVPVWWYDEPEVPLFFTLLSNGNLAWNTYSNKNMIRSFDGTFLKTVYPAAGSYLDLHELLVLPNGNYVFIGDVWRGNVNLSAYGGSASATVIDNVIEEVSPSGSLVWRWAAMDHISPAETAPEWRNPVLLWSPADPYHMNSVEPDSTGTGYIVSCRHMDAVLYIEKATGNIAWKLGGVNTAKSLRYVGDPYGNFGGQHDARVVRACAVPGLPHTIPRPRQFLLTVYDDGSDRNRAPRAVRYHVDELGGTAKLIEMITDPAVTYSPYTGSARRLSGGNWVVSWGGETTVGEYDPQQNSIFRLEFPAGFFSYRAVPVVPGLMSRAKLRAGMDAQFPR